MRIFRKGFAVAGRRKRRERGIALIFTLGILGLLTVLALGFASTAMLNNKISSNISHQQKARYIARIGAERALFALTQCPDISISNIFSKSGVEGDKDSCDSIWKLNTKLNGIPIYEITEDYSADSVGWEYIRDPQSVTNKSGKNDIIGRYAYVVVGEIGKLDPSVHLTDVASLSRKGGKNITEELSFGVPFRDENLFQSGDDQVLYNLMNEIFCFSQAFANTYKRRFFDFGNLLTYKYKIEENKKITKGTKNIFAYKNITSADKKAKWTRILGNILSVRPEPYHEYYRINKDSSTEIYPRFNLNRSDWENLTPEDLVNPDNLSKGNAIAWLVNWTHSRGEQSGDKAEWTPDRMAKQIAANIIQYCKGENAATVTNLSSESESESEPEPEWSPDNFPEYAGVGRHPMLNEIGVMLNIKADGGEQLVETGDTTTYSPKYTITANIGVELIDIFGLSSHGDVEVSFYGKLSFEYTKPKYTGLVFTYEEASNVTHNIGDSDTTKFSQTVSLKDWGEGYSGVWTNASGSDLITATIPIDSFVAPKDKADQVLANMKVKKVRLHIDTVILKCGNPFRFRDCAKISKTDKDGSYTNLVDYRSGPRESATSEKRKDYYEFSKEVTEYRFQAAWQAVDPRVNHYPIDWTLKLSEPTETKYPGTMGNKNDFDGCVDPDDKNKTYTAPDAVTDGDKEGVSDPAWTSDNQHLASAYIRHAPVGSPPMESLWELGCISRAEPWKTLNLKRSNPLALGGDTYDKGDANILDQVTLTSEKSRFGLINLNTDEHFVLETLLYQIPFNSQLHQAKEADSILEAKAEASNASSIYPVYSKKDTPNHEKDTCLACLIMERSKILRFEKRSDLLMDESDVASRLGQVLTEAQKLTIKNLRTALFSIPQTDDSSSTDAEEEQLAGKIMNLVAAEPYETVYIIAVGQSIKDIGSSEDEGITIFKNWAGTGNADKTYESDIKDKDKDKFNEDKDKDKLNETYKAYRRAGYIRPLTIEEIADEMPLGTVKMLDGKAKDKMVKIPPLNDKISKVKKGQYDLGADKISAESKIVMTLCFDPWAKKWKIKRFEYVE